MESIIDYYYNLPILYKDRLKELTSFLNKNPGYFSDGYKLDEKTIGFLLNSFNSLALHYSIEKDKSIEFSHDFFVIYDKYNNIVNKIIKNNPTQLNKFDFLINHPELISFNVRLNIFKENIKNILDDDETELLIDRNHILESSYFAINDLEPEDLRKLINIKFINERGLDLGGPLRDWFTNISLEIFNPNFALFTCYGQEEKYQPNKKFYVNEDHLSFFRFAGIIIARALIEGFCINANFTTSFWKQILNHEPNINDLKEIDLELYNSIQSLLNNDVDSLYFSFTLNEDQFGSYLSIPLKENGNTIDVTNENKNEYIQLLSDYYLKGSIKDQVNSFCEGFYSLLLPLDIRLFTPKELNMLIGGTASIDVNDFKNNTEYELPYTAGNTCC